jgi:hypothetical protein
MTNTANGSKATADNGRVTADEVTVHEAMHRLAAWKTRIDELRVQVDLAKLDLHEEAAKQLDLARNVNHVAAAKLRVAYVDAAANADVLRQGVLEFLHDVDEAFDAVQAVMSRG